MSAVAHPTRIDLLKLDVDTRLAGLWAELPPGLSPEVLELVGPFMRAAYGVGYCDAAKGDRTLFTDHGYRKSPR